MGAVTGEWEAGMPAAPKLDHEASCHPFTDSGLQIIRNARVMVSVVLRGVRSLLWINVEAK